jgi:nucleoside-diphosphate-sugar epimerase
VKTLVVGGTRFMGIATVARLVRRGHDVTILNRGTRPNPFGVDVRLVIGDRRDPSTFAALEAEGFDAIVDFCAYTAADVCALLEKLGGVQRLVHISSGTVYRLDPHLPWSEETPYGPAPIFGGYARGKIECEELLQALRSKATATTAVRFPWVLGPGSYADRERFVLNRLLDGAPLLLPGDGQAVQQFLSADQAAEAVVAVIERFDSGGWRAFNVASPGYVSIESFVRICAAIAGVEPRIEIVGGGPTGINEEVFDIGDCVFPYPNVNYILDVGASVEAGIAPRTVSLETTLEEVLEDLRAHGDLRTWRRTTAELRILDPRDERRVSDGSSCGSGASPRTRNDSTVR